MKRLGKAAAAAMASLLFVSTAALTAVEAGAALKEVERVAVQQGLLRGAVVDSEGKALVKAVIDVRDGKGDVVGLGITKKDGSFSLASIPDGEYLLSVNGEFKFQLQVAKDAEGSLSLVVSSQSAYSAGADGDPVSNTAYFIAGGLTAGALMLLVNSGDDCP